MEWPGHQVRPRKRGWSRVAVAGAIVAAALAAAGCLGLEKIQVFTVSVVNDTSAEIVVRGCGDFCSHALLTFDLAPGQSVDVNRTTNQHKYFSVTTTGGAHVGCVDLYFRHAAPGAIVPISQAGRCPGRSGLSPFTIAVIVGAVVGAGLVVLRQL